MVKQLLSRVYDRIQLLNGFNELTVRTRYNEETEEAVAPANEVCFIERDGLTAVTVRRIK
jgi:hypothetical protein